MTELQIGFVFGCAVLIAAIALLLYLILDYRRMCRASRFRSLDEVQADAQRAFHAGTGSYPIPARRSIDPTPLYGERR